MAKFNGSEGGVIPLPEAASWTARYRRNRPNPRVAKAHFFGKDILKQILEQENCVGIRMYYGIAPLIGADGAELDSADGPHQLILVGTDENGNDLEDGLVVDRSVTCPSECSETGILSGGG